MAVGRQQFEWLCAQASYISVFIDVSMPYIPKYIANELWDFNFEVISSLESAENASGLLGRNYMYSQYS